MRKTQIKDSHEQVLTVYTYEPTNPAIGLVLIVHGAGEHALRYDELAVYLQAKGFCVVSYDQYGHGDNRMVEDHVVFAEKDGDRMLLDGLYLVHEYASGINPKLPLFVIAHSMGSFLVRASMVEKKDLFDGYIFIGSSYFSKTKLKLSLALSRWIIKFKGYDYISPLMTALTQDKPYKSLKKRGLIHERYEWVTTDLDKQKASLEDPLLGKPFTISAQRDVFKLMLKSQTLEALKKHASNKLVHMMCGDGDPICYYGDGIKKLYGLYYKSGFTNLNYKVYANVRHELLNEVNRKEVMADILNNLMKEL